MSGESTCDHGRRNRKSTFDQGDHDMDEDIRFTPIDETADRDSSGFGGFQQNISDILFSDSQTAVLLTPGQSEQAFVNVDDPGLGFTADDQDTFAFQLQEGIRYQLKLTTPRPDLFSSAQSARLYNTDGDNAELVLNAVDPFTQGTLTRAFQAEETGQHYLSPEFLLAGTPENKIDGSIPYTIEIAPLNPTTGSPNAPPNASDDRRTVTGTDDTFDIDVLSNDSDPDGDSLSISSVGEAANGFAFAGFDNQIVYSPDQGFEGTDTFTYTVSDGNGGNSTAEVEVIVESDDSSGGGVDVGDDEPDDDDGDTSNPDDTPDNTPDTPAANVFLNPGRSFTVVEPADIFGAAGGNEAITLASQTTNVAIDANVERLDIPRSLSSLEFHVTNQGLEIQSNGTTVLSAPSFNQTTELRLEGGNATISQVGAQSFEIAGGANGTATIGPQSGGPIDIALGDAPAEDVGLTGVSAASEDMDGLG
jgi:hypothetical protein